MKTTTEENTTMNTTTTRTLIQLAEAAQALAAGAGNQAIPLMVTQEEKKLLDHFVSGFPGQAGGCTHLHGCPVLVEGQPVVAGCSQVLLLYQSFDDFDFEAYVIEEPTRDELDVLRNAHNEFSVADETNEPLHLLDELLAEKEGEWNSEDPKNLLDRGPFDFVIICGRGY